MVQKHLHYTNETNLESIKEHGLRVNSDSNLTEGGSWANQIYTMRPIYLCLHENEGYQSECGVLLEVVSDQKMVADLPGLVDLGAMYRIPSYKT